MPRIETRQTVQDLTTEELITKVCSDFANKMESKLDKKLDKLHDKLTEITQSINTLEKKVVSNQEAISKIVNNNDLTQQYLKRNTLRILGLPEEGGNETVLGNTLHFFKSKLNINCSEEDIDSIFRLGTIDKNKGTPRTILVNFVRNMKRSEVFNARNSLKNSRVSIFEDLTKTRFSLLVEAKKKVGNKKAWSSGGKVFIWSDEKNQKLEIKELSSLQLY